MKNRLSNLNDHLFAQIERLGDENMTPEQIEKECSRTEAIVAVSAQIIANADLAYKGAKLVADHGEFVTKYMPTITGKPTIDMQPAISDKRQ